MSPSRLCQVLLNVLVNAARDGEAAQVHVSARTLGDRVAIEVEDDGVGMSADVLERAFDPFFTTNRDRGGTGMGLSVCKSLVEDAQGIITLESTPGRGTRVTIWLQAHSHEQRATA